MKVYKESDYIIETFDEFMEREFDKNNSIDEYNQTERFDKLAKANPKKFGKLNNQFQKVASIQKQSKGRFNAPKYIDDNGKNKYANKIKQLSGNPQTSIYKQSPITTNRDLAKYKEKGLFDNYNPNEKYDYAAIAIGIGILDTVSTKYEEYDFIYEYLEQNLINECLEATYDYLDDYKFTSDDIGYCIECLQEWLEEQKDIEDGIVNECEMLKKFVRNKPIRW